MRKDQKKGKMKAIDVQKRLKKLGNPEHAAVSQRFFKTGPGEYGEGDIFVGVRVPVLRKLSSEFKDLPVSQIEILLHSPIHEERMLGILLYVRLVKRGDDDVKRDIYNRYLQSTKFINNWDLVDVSAEHIVGAYLMDKSRRPLYRLARSKSLWERRIAIMATFHYIKRREYSETLKIAGMLLVDRHDLIHKAVGWMLREIGKRDITTEEAFLKEHYENMPRTMLRYAIEKFPEDLRQRYLQGTI